MINDNDNRLFAPNSPINRTWYFINLFILCILAIATHIGVRDYIIKNANPGYEMPIKFFTFLIYFVLFATFLMLVDRRAIDTFGNRDGANYILLSKIITFIISMLIAMPILAKFNDFVNSILPPVSVLFACILAIIVFILGLMPRKIEEPTKINTNQIIFRQSKD